jgi:hypothetical protein
MIAEDMTEMTNDNQLRHLIILGALMAFAIGGLLWGVQLLTSTVPASTAPIARANTASAVTPKAAIAAVAPLPTIVQLSPTSSPGFPTAVGQATVGATAATATSAPGHMAAAADLAARLLQQLSCLAPGARHDVTLEMAAAERARQDNTSLPKQGAIQIAERNEQRILIGADMLADLSTPGGHCGETLIFGIPPLDWLPNGARFGLGADVRPDGAVIVIVTR